MSGEVNYYAVHSNYWPFLISLLVGWLILFVGVLRYGRRFAFFALPLGIAIPLSQFASQGLWGSLLDGELDGEIVTWNAVYWLLPGVVVTAIALLIRRLRAPR